MRRMWMKVKYMKKMRRAVRRLSGKTWAGIGIALTFLVLVVSVLRWRAQSDEIVMAP